MQNSRQISLPKTPKNLQRASAGTQREQMVKNIVRKPGQPIYTAYCVHVKGCTKRQKKHINFVAPTQNSPVWAPEKSLRASFPGKVWEKGTHIKFIRGEFGVKKFPRNFVKPCSAVEKLVFHRPFQSFARPISCTKTNNFPPSRIYSRRHDFF